MVLDEKTFENTSYEAVGPDGAGRMVDHAMAIPDVELLKKKRQYSQQNAKWIPESQRVIPLLSHLAE